MCTQTIYGYIHVDVDEFFMIYKELPTIEGCTLKPYTGTKTYFS